jgi:hypothetical protein
VKGSVAAGDQRLVRAAGLTGAAAAALSAWSDFVLQYTPDPSHLMSRQYLFLLDRSPADLLLGHYVGIFAILLQIAGFWAVTRGLALAGRAAALSYFFLGASAMALGAAFHATFAPIGLALHTMAGDPQRIAALADGVRPVQTALGADALRSTAGGRFSLSRFRSTIASCKSQPELS